MKTLPRGRACRHAGDLDDPDDPDSNNAHVQISVDPPCRQGRRRERRHRRDVLAARQAWSGLLTQNGTTADDLAGGAGAACARPRQPATPTPLVCVATPEKTGRPGPPPAPRRSSPA